MTFTTQARGRMAASSAEHARSESTTATRAAGTPRFLAARGMRVSRPEDAGERQAERIADAVMAPDRCLGCTPEAPCASCASGIQRSAEGAGPLSASLPGLGSGRPLDRPARDFFEPRFGRDLGAVRVHSGSREGSMARSLAARAFTLGNDIVFAPGRYEPESDSGRRLMAHELAHVVSGGTANTVSRVPDAGVTPDAGATPDAALAAAAAAGPTDAGVPLPAGVPAAPTPLFDGLFGTCLTPEEGVRRDAFALRHMHLERYIPSTTFGMFDADYFPLVGLMPVTVKMKFNFVSADNAPGMLEWISRSMAGEDLSRFFWSDTEKADFKSAYIGRVSARWSAQHTMTSSKPCWDFRAIPLVTPVEVADDASAHYVTTVHKSPGPGIDYKSATNDPDVAHPERPATATLYQSDVREEPDFNSASVATTERQRLESALAAAAASPVLFGNDSDVISPAARPALTAFADAARQKNPSDPLIPLKVDGFASLDGDATHNVDLSEKRAVAVRSFLAGLGVPQPIGVLGHGPVGAARDAANRRADISVDHAFETTYTANRYSVGEHEFGHMLGLPDEYQNNTSGVLGAQQTLYSGLVAAAGVPGPAVWGVDTASQMSNGIDVLPRHYVTLWEALGRMTAPDIAQSEWSIS
jgi:outer membrane protein OmpA-like peptidoglycan-associated protein